MAAKFEALKADLAKLKAQGIVIEACDLCHFKAAQIVPEIGDLDEAICLVCDHRKHWLNFSCPRCKKISRLEDGGEFKCPKCKLKLDEAGLIDTLDKTIVTKDNYFDIDTPANCSECEGYHTVIPYEDNYLCVRCFEVTEQLEQCQWCSEANNGDMSNSAWAGCGVCDGRAGDLGDD